MKTVRCFLCNTPKNMRDAYYEINLIKYNAKNMDELNNNYMCRTCRSNVKTHQAWLDKSLIYHEIQKLVPEEFEEWNRRGKTASAWGNCLSNIKAILDKYNIFTYSLVERNGKVIGIMADKLPFLGTVFIELKIKGKLYDR